MVNALMVLFFFLVLRGLVHGNGLRIRKCTGDCQKEDVNARMSMVMRLKIKEQRKCMEEHQCPTVAKAMFDTPCSGGWAGEYECSNVDLLAFVPLATLGCSGDGNDIWGWTDPETGKEYALMGCFDGTSFIDVTDPINPVVLAFLPTHTKSSIWRDLKVYKNYVFIGSEASGHGLQVFDLTKLRNLRAATSGVNVVKSDAHYGEFGNSHNIVLNEETGFLYAVGSRTCTSGLHVVNIRNPLLPQFAGCFGSDGYIHDAQCIVYSGPDSRYQGKEICFCYSEDSLTIVDVEDKEAMKILSRVSYVGCQYIHQGWLNEIQSHLLLNDELDEWYGTNPHTKTLIWNVEDLEKPKLINSFYSEKQSTDHNLYIKGNLVFESNYCAGLRVLDASGVEAGELKEVGYFDVEPECDSLGFRGTWSNYPYFESSTIIVSSIERGLFVLKYTGTHIGTGSGEVDFWSPVEV